MLRRVIVSTLVTLLANQAAGQVLYGEQELNANFGNSITIQIDGDAVSITMVGPANRWFGVGFGGSTMEDTYAIIAEGTGSGTSIREQKLNDGTGRAGTELTQTVTQISDTTDGDVRTVSFNRAREGSDSDYYTFPEAAGDIALIYARGSDDDETDFSAHGSGNFGTSSIAMQETTAPTMATSSPTSSPSMATSSPTSSPTASPEAASDSGDDDDDDEEKFSGSVDITDGLELKMWIDGNDVNLTICATDLDGNWFGVGFCGASACGMDGTYALINLGSNTPDERILGNGDSGDEITTRTGYTATAGEDSRCLTIYRSCDTDEDDAADLDCGSDLSGETTVTRKLIGAKGVTSDLQYHQSSNRWRDIDLELCAYEDGEPNSDCQKASSDQSSAFAVQYLAGFILSLFAFVWNY